MARPKHPGHPAHSAHPTHPTRPGPHYLPPPPSPDAPAETLGAGDPDSRTAAERWAALTPRTRRTITAGLALGAAVTALLLLRPPHSDPAAASSPYPTQTTYLHYQGRGPAKHTYRFLLRVESGSPVTVSRLRLPFAEFGTRTTPRLPLTVNAGDTAPLTVEIRVRHCPSPPRTIDLPHLDLTLRNQRALQQHSFLFGGAFPHALARELSTACPAERPGTNPSRR
ncbi:hypothetical protein ACFW9D_20790 [Streptomyces sp. NPDC059524]|uniref:hypothetical protein n=1 Tax=Streptomyces sp. NPDC059524 TaxID=3346856 RepID=UPI0036C2557C